MSIPITWNVQHWRTRCSITSKLQRYVDFNHDYNVDKYVLAVNTFKFRRTMSNFRSSSKPLMIEKGLHYNLDREARTCPCENPSPCPYCETCIENELRLVLQCPLHASLRCRYLHDMFVNDVSEASYVRLMSSDNETAVKKIAMFHFFEGSKTVEWFWDPTFHQQTNRLTARPSADSGIPRPLSWSWHN